MEKTTTFKHNNTASAQKKTEPKAPKYHSYTARMVKGECQKGF